MGVRKDARGAHIEVLSEALSSVTLLRNACPPARPPAWCAVGDIYPEAVQLKKG